MSFEAIFKRYKITNASFFFHYLTSTPDFVAHDTIIWSLSTLPTSQQVPLITLSRNDYA